MKLGIFGGTFDPFTLAHREIVKQVLEQKLVDRVVVAPTIVTWHREGKTAWLDDKQKVDVMRALLEAGDLLADVDIYTRDLDLRAMCAGNAELEKRYVEPHRFIDTLVDIKTAYGSDCELFPILGSDSWANFTAWSSWREIAALSQQILVVNGREGSPSFAANPEVPNATWLSISQEFAGMSSSAVRDEFTSVENYVACMLDKLGCNNSQDILLHTPIFDVVQGNETSTGLKPVCVNAPDWVTFIVAKKGKFLVEKQFRYGSSCEVEEFPCGMVESGEDPLDAAVRELEEETGYKVLDKSKVSSLGKMSPNPAFMTNTMHCFYADLDVVEHKKVKVKLDLHEDIKCKFVDQHKFISDVIKRASAKDAKVPAMLLSAIMLYHGNWIKSMYVDNLAEAK